jgi:hypothetical protein
VALSEEKRRVTRIALRIVNDLAQHPGGPSDFAETELAQTIQDAELSEADLLFGLLNICRLLLVELERAGNSVDEILAWIERQVD